MSAIDDATAAMIAAKGVIEQLRSENSALRARVVELEAICVDHFSAHSAAAHEMAKRGITGDVKPGKMLHDALTECDKLRARAEKAEAALEEARRDIERLDWLDWLFSYDPDDPQSCADGWMEFWEKSTETMLLRAAIDAARATARSKKEPKP